MKDFFLHLLSLAYACVGVVSAVAYWPTIRDLYFYKKASANASSYAAWTATSGVAFLYSVFVLSDTLLRVVSTVNFVACATVLVLSLRLRRKDMPNA